MGLVYWVLGSLDSPIRLGKPPFTNSADFFNIVQTAFDSPPPPLVLNMNVANFSRLPTVNNQMLMYFKLGK